MTNSRRHLINAETTPYYHIMTRCVRRAFLCGQDELTGRDFSHRRQWLEDRMYALTEVFAVDVASYAIMHNHYHLVLHIDQDTAKAWSIDEIFKRWFVHFVPIPLVQRYCDGIGMSEAELRIVHSIAEEYRQRLMSISWFMRMLNEFIARKANKEDKCKGRFWESRFKSQALLDETALLTCMAYVDLNPVRANIAKTPETSEFTSIRTRIKQQLYPEQTPKPLMPFACEVQSTTRTFIPLDKEAYLTLVDWTGRCIREDKRGAIPSHIAPILERIGMEQRKWLTHSQHFESRFKCMAGTWSSMKKAAQKLKRCWFQGKQEKPLPT